MIQKQFCHRMTVLIKWDFPQPPPPVTNKCNGEISFGAFEDKFFR